MDYLLFHIGCFNILGQEDGLLFIVVRVDWLGSKLVHDQQT